MMGEGRHYGYQWWIDATGPDVAFAALGFRGQVIVVVPASRLVVVTNGRWRGVGRPAAEQSREVHRFIGDRLAPFLVPGYAPD